VIVVPSDTLSGIVYRRAILGTFVNMS